MYVCMWRERERMRMSWSSVLQTAFIFNDNSTSFLCVTATHFKRMCVCLCVYVCVMCKLNEIDGEDGFLNCC